MIPTTVILLAAKSTVVLAAAFAIARALRRTSAATRYLVWLATFAALLILPALAIWAPLNVAILPAAASPASAPIPSGTSTAAEDLAAFVDARDAAPRVEPAVSSVAMTGTASMPSAEVPYAPYGLAGFRAVTDLATGLLALWATVALILAASLAAASLAAGRIVRRATPLRGREWLDPLLELCDRLDLMRPPRLLRSEQTAMPFSCGLLRPVIVLPAESDGWTEGCRRAVLLHELAHVRRRDLVGHVLSHVMCALYWFHPLVWVAATRLRAESERACDDAALAAGQRAPDYAEHLLDILVAGRASATPLMALAMARRGDFEGRLLDILDSARVRAMPSRRQTALLVGAIAFMTVVVGAVAPTAAARTTDAAQPSAGATSALAAAAQPFSSADSSGAASLSGHAAPDSTSSAVSAPVVVHAAAQDTFGGTWALRFAEPGEVSATRAADGDSVIVHVALRTPGLNTFYIPASRFEGLGAAQIASSSGELVRFRLPHDAGTFTFNGAFRRGQGTGDFTFAPDPAFADALARRGIVRPTPAQQFSLARHDVSLAYVDELAAQGYPRPTPNSLDRAGMSGADLEYLREMGTLGYRLGTLDALVSLSNNGVDPAYVRELASLGYSGLSADELRRLRSQGVTADTIRRMNDRAERRLSREELADSPRGKRDPAPRAGATPLEGRWAVHGVQGDALDLELFWVDDTNWRRSFESPMFSGISAADVVAPSTSTSFRIAQDAGSFEFEGTIGSGRGGGQFRFRPNREFASTLRSLVIADSGEVTDHQLKNLAWGGMSADAVRGLQALIPTPLTFRDVIDMAIFRVTPDYARAMQSLGVSGANTVRGLVELRHSNVPVDYARELHALGYRRLDHQQLERLWRARVTPAFIRELREAGVRELSTEVLIRRTAERRREGRGGS